RRCEYLRSNRPAPQPAHRLVPENDRAESRQKQDALRPARTDRNPGDSVGKSGDRSLARQLGVRSYRDDAMVGVALRFTPQLRADDPVEPPRRWSMPRPTAGSAPVDRARAPTSSAPTAGGRVG